MVSDSLLQLDGMTLPDLLRATAETTPDQVIVHLAAAGHERIISYQQLYADAKQVALALQQSGLIAGQVILVSLESSADFLAGFWGAIIAGLIPAPLAAEPERILSIWATLEQPALLSSTTLSAALVALAAQQTDQTPMQQRPLTGPWPSSTVQLFCATPSAANQATASADDHQGLIYAQPQPNDLAYLQFSSGSTGDPRGIELTHAGLLANLRQMGSACAINAHDSVVTWMPYYHDMGLIAAHLLPLAAGIKQVKIDEFYFARRPAIWLETVDRQRATLLTAAPFALDLVQRRVKPERLAGLDLRCVRVLIVGAEPIVAANCRAFLAQLAPTGFAPQALLPVYGLAEACVGVTLSPLGTGMKTHLLDRQMLVREARASSPVESQQLISSDQANLIELVDVGEPVPGCQIRIVDDHDCLLEDGLIGQIQLTGPQLMRGYYRSSDPSAAFCDGWLRTGDLGFLRNGRLVITGRAKEIVIVNGHKHHAPDLEELVSKVEGLNAKRIAVCGALRAGSNEERVIVFLSLPPRSQTDAALPALSELVRKLRRATGTTAIDIVTLRASQFPRTTSGKLKRNQLRARYEAGEFDSEIAAVNSALAQRNASVSNMTSDKLEREIIQFCAQALGIDPSLIGVHDSVFDLGATSLQLMDLLAAIGDRFKLELDAAALRQHPTPAGLASWLRLNSSIMSTETTSSQKVDNQLPTIAEPIAVIGMACRLPDADTPEQFWANLVAGVDSVHELPRSRDDGLASPAPHGPAWGSILDAVSYFDASFFNIEPAEAAAMDPQQRILLELAYHGLERAGYAAGRRIGRQVGVFIGVGEASYQQLLLPLVANDDQLHPSTATGNMRNLIAGRIAHCLDLNGPAIAIDTACSSTLVALHLARTSLLVGDCDLAIVGGINLNLTETPYQLLARAGALSPSGRCRAFDDAADGIVLGEGAGVIILERLDSARRNGDQVLALVRGSAINNDGRALSPMAPNPLRQAEALRQAYRDAKLDPASVSYIEAHGTGTAIGDPTEARSLAQVFPASTNLEPRIIGSVKTNLGHLLNAAGIPALIKVILMLQHRQIPPSLHYTTPNHRFELAQAGMAINTSVQPWRGPLPLRAGVNSFGFGGTNAHVILEAPPIEQVATTETNPFQLLAISARNEQALYRLAATLAERIRDDNSLCVADLYFTLAERQVFERRAVLSGDALQSLATVANTLDDLAAGQVGATILQSSVAVRRRKVALLFAGQGAQYPQQGAALYQQAPSFKATLDAASAQLGQIKGRTLLEWCFAADVDSAALADTAVTQPLLVAFEVALARLVISWGLRPDAVVGHSVGELAAACIAGVLSFEQVLELARERGRLMAASAEPGMMAAVFAPESAVLAVVGQSSEALTIAAYNTPNQVVIAGKSTAVKRALESLERDGFNALIVNQTMAYHSPLIQPAVQSIAEAAAIMRPTAPNIPFLSTVNVEWLRGSALLDAEYWAAQVIEPVRFAPAIARLISEGFDTFIEIGPGSTLAAFARQILAGREPGWMVEALLRRGEDDCASIRAAIARLWVEGVDFDLAAIATAGHGRRVNLPTYPFERERHWLPVATTRPAQQMALDLKPALDQTVLLHGQPIAAVNLRPTANGYSLILKAADGQTLLALADLRSAEAIPQPDLAPAVLQQIVWSKAELPEPAHDPIQHWVIIADLGNALANKLAATLNFGNQHCVLASSQSLTSVLATVSAQRYGLIMLTDCGPASIINQTADDEQPLNEGVLQLLDSIQSVLALPRSAQPTGLWVVTAGAYAVGDTAEVAAERALIAGLAAALPDQHIEFPCVALDLELNTPEDQQTKIIVCELQAKPMTGVFAWRDDERLKRELAALPAIAPPVPPTEKPGRVIMIAGGIGGVGAQLARHLASHNQPMLILLGRSPLDPSRAALLAELEALGAQARYQQVDICDQQQVEQLIARLATAGTGIFGVIQAAGVIDVASLQTKSAAQFAAVLEPKVKGTWLLARALERHNQRPAFFITCSSIAAVLPGLGGGIPDYVAANAFLDAFAASERRAGRTMTALNWAAWDGIGWAATPMLLDHLRQCGLPPLHPHQAFQAFDQACYSGHSQIVILAPPEPKISQLPQLTIQADPVALEAPASASDNPSTITQQIQALVGKALKLAPTSIPHDASFLSLGLDSLQAVDLVKQLEQATGTVLPLTLFFEFQTISALAEHLQRVIKPKLAESSTVLSKPTASLDGSFPLAPAQIAFYVGHQLYPANPAFALVRQHIAGLLDQTALQHALIALVERHPMLRAQFEPLDQEHDAPRQRILAPAMLPINLWFEQREAPADLEALERTLVHHQFDLFKAPLFRVVLCRYTDDRWVLLLLLHHSIADGWSTSILLEELWQVYTKQTQGLPVDLPPLTCSFEQYVAQTIQSAASPQAASDRAWWSEQLQHHSAALAWSLPKDETASATSATTPAISSLQQQLDRVTSAGLRQLAAELDVSLFHLLLATYARQLADWSQASAIAINVAEHGRGIRLVGVERMVGCCADHLPLLLQLEATQTASDLALVVRDQWTGLQQHASISALDLARLSGVRHQTGPRAPGAASFSLARFPGALPQDCPIEIQALTASTATASTQLSLLISELDGALQCTWMYAPAAFQVQTIERLAASYQQKLADLINPAATQPLPERIVTQALLVPERIAEQCIRQPERIAVSADGQALSYAALAHSANQLAAWLLANGARPNQAVALLTQPGIASIVGIVGSLWAGVPWLGLNHDYPLRQLAEQIDQAGVKLLLYHADTSQLAQQISEHETKLQLLNLDTLNQQHTAQAVLPRIASPAADGLAYIMFTSGSTGRPKAVPISHRSLANYLQWLVETFDYGPNDRLLQTAALSFDAAISQILGPLTSGGTVVALSPLVVRDPHALLEALERERPTIWRSVPALWERVLSAIEHRVAQGQQVPALTELRLIGVGGEALPASYVRRWMAIYAQRHQIVNHYGPTEATINATAYLIPQRPVDVSSQIPIGRAIREVVTRVLDQQGRSCPALTIGELYIGGSGLSAGYLGRPDLTALQFVPDPLRPGERLYRTGDLVRELGDGNLVFIGRADDQIKLRGYRIEPAEIEAALDEHEAITKAVVCLIEDGEQAMLVAYLEVYAELPPIADLRHWLAKRLPPQMIPQRFHVLPTLPTTSSGKIDRAQLRQLPIPVPTRLAGSLPETPTELLLAEIWCEVLKLPAVNRDADFFELGGDSLLLLQVLTRLEGRVPMLPRAASFYQHSTLASFAKALDAASQLSEPSIPQDLGDHGTLAQQQRFALTPAQIGFMLTEALDPAAATTWCARLVVNGPLDLGVLQQAFELLVKRHLMLRVRILVNERPPRQQAEPFARPPQLAFDDLQAQLGAGADELHLIDQHWQSEQAQRFQLDHWPLLRLHVLRLAPTRHVWLIAAHHIIGDGWSAWIFGQELLHSYDSLVRGELPNLVPLRSTFSDYVNKIQQSRPNALLHEQYWLNSFAKPYHRPLLQSSSVEASSSPAATTINLSRVLPAETLAQLRRVAAAAGLTPYILLLTLFVHQLRQLSAAEDLVIGTAHSGRDFALADIERLFGCFATALPIRVSHSPLDASVGSLLQPVAQAFKAAYLHALPPAEIARIIGNNNGISAITATGAQFFFTFLDFDALGSLHSENLAIDWQTSYTEVQPPLGATELLFAARAANGNLRLTLQGIPAKFESALLENLLDNLIAEMTTLIASSDRIHAAKRDPASLATAKLDAALIGYLPPSQRIAAMFGMQGDAASIRQQLRSLLFPDGQPRWAERLETSIGASALLCLPRFAEELRPENAADLEAEIANGMLLAQARSVRCVSLAGMLPSLTGYGFGVLRALAGHNQARPALTTGHATTVVAVAQTLEAALNATNCELATSELALVGLGSIGQSVLQLVLHTLPHPRSLVLCDTAGNLQRLETLAQGLRTQAGYQGAIEIVAADRGVPAAVYRAQVIVAATSTAGIIDVARLEAGTIVVDDSFPPCLDTELAIQRMQQRGDVLIVGGGQLACGPSQRTIDLPISDPGLRERILAELLPDAAASCQLEALLWAADPTLPLTQGLVEIEAALRYRAAVIRAGFGPAPLHLQNFLPDPAMVAELLRKQVS